jgi:hypothetical protein
MRLITTTKNPYAIQSIREPHDNLCFR